MSDRQFFKDGREPLSSEEREQFRHAARQQSPPVQVVGLTGLTCGLSNLALAHLHDDWIRGDKNSMKIILPSGGIDCESIGDDGRCWLCKQTDTRPELETDHAGRRPIPTKTPRSIPVPDTETREILDAYFSHHDTIDLDSNIAENTNHIATKAGIDRPITPGILRNTYGVILVEKGFELETILRVMGLPETQWTKTRVRRCFGRYADEFNPFNCGAETSDGTRCERPSQSRSAQCWKHQEEYDNHICGAPTGYNVDGVCQRIVSSETDRCHAHRENDSRYICGSENKDGSTCQRRVSSSDDQCFSHSRSN